VAGIWARAATNAECGYFLPGVWSVFLLILLVWWWSARYGRVDEQRRGVARQRQEAAYRAVGLDQIDVMPGVEFENYVATVLRGIGYQTSLTKVTGDFGIDIIAIKDGIRTAVQCKRQGSAVGGAAVQQVVAGAVMHQCTAVMVVCNRTFTRAAQELAARHNCRLVDRRALEKLALSVR
jgi:restriction system protein